VPNVQTHAEYSTNRNYLSQLKKPAQSCSRTTRMSFIMSFRLDNAMLSVLRVLSSCSCSLVVRLFERPKNYSLFSPFSLLLLFLLHFRLSLSRIFIFPFLQPLRPLIPNRCRVTILGAMRARSNYYHLRYFSPTQCRLRSPDVM